MFTSFNSTWKFRLLQLCTITIASSPRLVVAADVPVGLATPVVGTAAIDKKGWTATADSFVDGFEPAKVLDGNADTYWQSQPTSSKPLPHFITIDMKSTYLVNSFAYRPQNAETSSGNIGAHMIHLSLDGANWGSPVASGTYRDNNAIKTTNFAARNARFVRLSATDGDLAIASDIKVYATTVAPPGGGLGQWSPTIDFPLVPAAAAVEHDSGKLLVWSSYSPSAFNGPLRGGKTVTATYDPKSGAVSQRIVTNTGHDMFCPGISVDGSGRVVVTGGNDAPQTSIYDPAKDAWITGAQMNVGRGYQSQATLSDGRIFTIGGSWSGGRGGKDGEVYDPVEDKWTWLHGCKVGPMLDHDKEGIYKQDNHAWLFAWKQGSVFQAGPSRAMNWYGTSGTGSQKTAGLRANDPDAMNANAVMYDALNGKILAVGGAPDYTQSPATNNAHIITIGNPNTIPTVATIGSMKYARSFANSVVLPDGKVFITGGQTYAESFTDYNSNLTPELFDPVTLRFTELAPMVSPRNYHSVALLLPDGTVFNGGGGLCGEGCTFNHYDGQIFSPPYLFTNDQQRAARPVINSVSDTSIAVGDTFTATTNTAVASWALIRYASVTHTVNTDQRRIALASTAAGQTYTFKVPNDPGIATPGYWMLFALDSVGVPSVAKTVRITTG